MGSERDSFSDTALQDLLRTDANDAIRILYDRHYAHLCITANRIVGNTSAAEDIIQEIFIKLWKKRKTLEIRTSFKAYLKRATINAALNYLRDHKKISESWENIAADKQISMEKADHLLSQQELEKSIAEAIEALPPGCRAVFVLSRFEKLKPQEIADQLGIANKTVENQIGKALKQLRSHLKPLFDGLMSILL